MGHLQGASKAMTAMPQPKLEDGRSADRRRVLLGGRIVFGDFTLACTIRDLSETGARLRLERGASAPESFILIDLPHGAAYEARVAWRAGDQLGVAFTGAHDLTRPTPPELRHVRQLWMAARFR
jgi:hypothetical protein